MTHSRAASTLSVRILPETRERLEKLSVATGRTKSFLTSEAIDSYLETQSWQVEAIKKAVEKADRPQANFIEHHKVMKWLNSWSNKNENEEAPPK